MSDIAKKEFQKISLLALGISAAVTLAGIAVYHFAILKGEDDAPKEEEKEK